MEEQYRLNPTVTLKPLGLELECTKHSGNYIEAQNWLKITKRLFFRNPNYS